jgi:hypothetical protein
MKRVFRIASTMTALLLALGATSARRVYAEPSAATAASPTVRANPAGILAPTADPLIRPFVGASVLTYPPSLIAEGGLPIRGRFSATAFLGYSWIPNGLGGIVSAAVRAQLAVPSERRWGIVAIAQGVAGAAIIDAEDAGVASVTAVEAVVSSPLRPWRAHAGVALHTMPGDEYPGGEYDWSNAQVTPFLSLERCFSWGSVQTESVWGAIGADEGYDSVLINQLGLHFHRGNLAFRVSAGVLVNGVGSNGQTIYPMPPMLAMVVKF